MIYVDDIRVPKAASRAFRDGVCRMTADDVDELHAAAKRLGLGRRRYKTDRRLPHYPLTVEQHERAIAAGAVYRHMIESMRAPMSMRPIAEDGRVLDALRSGATTVESMCAATRLTTFAVSRALLVLVREGKAQLENGIWRITSTRASSCCIGKAGGE